MPEPSLIEQWDVAVPANADPEKTYIGRRIAHPSSDDHNDTAVLVRQAGDERPLDQRPEQPSTAFEWGYRGVGPTALAAALLADHLGYLPPTLLYFRYRDQVVSRLRHDGWGITSSDISAWLAANLTGGRP